MENLEKVREIWKRLGKSGKHGRWLKKVIRNFGRENVNFFLKETSFIVCEKNSVPPQTRRQVPAYVRDAWRRSQQETTGIPLLFYVI